MCNMGESAREREKNPAKQVDINECKRFLELQNFEPGNELQLCARIYLGADL